MKRKEKYFAGIVVFTCLYSLVAEFSMYVIGGDTGKMLLQLACVMWVFLNKNLRDRFNRNSIMVYAVSCFYVILTPVIIHQEMPFVSMVVALMFCLCIISLQVSMKRWIYEKVVRILAFVFFAGIIEYLLYVVAGINFFWASTVRPGVEIVPVSQGFFIVLSESLFPRFMSLFEEPGVLGNMCAFLIATLDYKKFKKEFFIFLVAGFLSLSLSFYLLLGSWMLLNFRKIIRIKLRYLIVGVFIVAFLGTYFYEYIEVRIIERVVENDVDTVDNRNSYEVKKAFGTYIASSSAFFGMGNRTFRDWTERIGETGAGVIPLLFSYGIIAILVLFLGTNYLYFKLNGIKKSKLAPIIMYWISFYPVTLWLNPITNICLFFQCYDLQTNSVKPLLSSGQLNDNSK